MPIHAFNSRGHYCNYCRKILSNKCPNYHHHTINLAIWSVWENRHRRKGELLKEFIQELKDLPITNEEDVKSFNRKLKTIKNKYFNILDVEV